MGRRNRPPSALESGKFAYAGLDRVIHERARLGIMTSLVARPDGLAFTDLKEMCDLTDGNLNRHLDVLHEAGLVEIRKEHGRGRVRTVCHVTTAGRAQFLAYLAELERVVAEAAAAAKATPGTAHPRLLPSQA
jgi:DNA-binding MarR family transcriptional regulator